METTLFDNVADALGDFFLFILGAFLSPLLLLLDLLNILDPEVSFG